MAEVHEAISKHSTAMHIRIKQYLALNAQREALIDEAVALCEQNKPFTTSSINAVTATMNELATQGNVPPQQTVSEDMVREYVAKKAGKNS
ncbi:MAG: DUF2533 family protein [Bacilli bacterium]